MSKQALNWLVIGVKNNWETALAQPVPIWGLKTRYQAEFQALNVGDFIWFYSTKPISGVIGVGMAKDKYIDHINLIWGEEQKRKEVIWPLRFRIYVLKVIPQGQWKAGRVRIDDFHLNWQVGFQLLKQEHATILSERAEAAFGMTKNENFFSGTTITQPSTVKEMLPIYTMTQEEAKTNINHKDLQDKVAEIGKLQFYHTELEYRIELPGENKSLDVVWKREINGAPTFAFEVELSGMVEKAINRLRFAFKRWNSRPRIVIPTQFVKKVHNIIAAEDRDFSEQVKIYEPTQIDNLLEKKQELKTMERNLEIY